MRKDCESARTFDRFGNPRTTRAAWTGKEKNPIWDLFLKSRTTYNYYAQITAVELNAAMGQHHCSRMFWHYYSKPCLPKVSSDASPPNLVGNTLNSNDGKKNDLITDKSDTLGNFLGPSFFGITRLGSISAPPAPQPQLQTATTESPSWTFGTKNRRSKRQSPRDFR